MKKPKHHWVSMPLSRFVIYAVVFAALWLCTGWVLRSLMYWRVGY